MTTTGVYVELPELIALRAQANDLNLQRYKNISQGMHGAYLSRTRGRGMDFAEVRSYQAGDDIRHMDWRVTARTGQPHTKLYMEERERPVFLLVDFAPSMYFGTRVSFKSVCAAKIAALLGWACVKQGNRIGALLFSAEQHLELRPQLRQRGMMPLLHGLVDFCKIMPPNNALNGGLTSALARLRQVVKPGSLIILLSDFYHLNAEDERYLAQITRHNQLMAFAINDPLETALPPSKCYSISDGTQFCEVDWANPLLRHMTRQHHNQHAQTIAAVFRRYAIPLLTCSTHQPVAERLQQVFGGKYERTQ